MSKKKRILHIIDHLGPGGAQAALCVFVATLKENFDLDVAVLGNSGTYAQALESYNVPVFFLGSSHNRWNPSSFWKLRQLVKRGNYEIIHAHLFKSIILGGIVAQESGRSFIIHDQTVILDPFVDPYIRNPLIRRAYLFAYRAILTSTNYVLVLNPGTRNQYLANYQLPPHKIQIIANPVDLRSFPLNVAQEQSLRESLGINDQKIVLMVGRLEPEKDWDTFLRVAEIVADKDPAVFVVAGSGSEKERLEQQAKKMNLSVRFLGYRTDVPSLLAQADVFMLCSRQEASPVALLEAMAAQRAIVATRTIGASNEICHGENGLLADVGDAQILAEHVLRFLNDHSFARECGIRARARVERTHHVEIIAKQLTDLYNGLGTHEIL